MKTNKELRKQAKFALKGNWGIAILSIVIMFAISAVLGGCITLADLEQDTLEVDQWIAIIVALLASFFVMINLEVGVYNAYSALVNKGDNRIVGNMFNFGFKEHYWHKLGGYLLMEIFVFLWSLLLFIPGIIFSFAYYLTPYILHEEPELGVCKAIKKSRAMMKGHKAQLFWMTLGFFGLMLASVITLGIALLWLIPYMYASYGAFYEAVKIDVFGMPEPEIEPVAEPVVDPASVPAAEPIPEPEA